MFRVGSSNSAREFTDPQVVDEQLLSEVDQPGVGSVRLLAPFVRVGREPRAASPAPELGAHTTDVMAELR